MFSLLKPAKTETAAAPAPANAQRPAERPADRRVAAPRVDIRETDEAVLIVADMPGVAANGVEVRVHGDALTLRGTSRVQEPERFAAIWREWAARDYERSFRLGHAIDGERISASAKDGVVRITLPKRAAAQPKKIAVTAV
jgi:HSP20 family protein